MKRCPVCKTVYPDDANFCPMDAGRLIDDPVATDPSLDLPTMQARLVGGRFRLGPQLGGHRTGEVYSAEDMATGHACAVKLIAAAVFPTPLVAQRTERELKQLVKVSSDRVARVLDVGKQGDRLYVAMELIGGVTLGEIVAANGPMPVDQAVRLSLEIGEALAEAAKLGVIHRDVSPKNVLIVADARGQQRVRLINFGIPTPVSDKVLGVPEFLSPEQAEGKPVDQRSNIYSLGTMLYYMLVGEPPFGSASGGDPRMVLAQQTSATPVPPSRRAGIALPPELERLILKALEKASSRRHLTLRQLLGELESALAHLPATVPAPLPFGGAAASQRTMQAAPLAAAGPSPRTSHASSKTMHGIGLKDIMAHAAPPEAAPPPAPPREPPPGNKTPAVIVAAAPPAEAEQWAPTQPAVGSAPKIYPHPYQPQPQPQSFAPPEPPPLPQFSAAPSLPSPPLPPLPPLPPPQVASPIIQPSRVSPNKAPAPKPAQPFPAPSLSPSPATSSGARGKGGGGRSDSVPGRPKGRFRETMWFKKGELDEATAAAAAAEGAAVEAPAKADDLPIEDRYKDDGTLTAADRDRLSLRTGGTQMNMPVQNAARSIPGEKLSEREMIAELRTSNIGLIVLIIAAVLVIGGVLVYFIALR